MQKREHDYSVVYCAADRFGNIQAVRKPNHKTIYFTRECDCRNAVRYANGILPEDHRLHVAAFGLVELMGAKGDR